MTYQEVLQDIHQKLPYTTILELLGEINGNVHRLTEKYKITVRDVLLLRNRCCPLRHVATDEVEKFLFEQIENEKGGETNEQGINGSVQPDRETGRLPSTREPSGKGLRHGEGCVEGWGRTRSTA